MALRARPRPNIPDVVICRLRLEGAGLVLRLGLEAAGLGLGLGLDWGLVDLDSDLDSTVL